MDERLGKIPPKLSLGDIELLGEQARRPARGAIAFEPARRAGDIALVEEREGYEEATEQKGAFRSMERLIPVTEPVGIPVLRQVFEHGAQGGVTARIVRGDGAPNRWEQE